MSQYTKTNINCIGTSHDGQILIIYENKMYKLYSLQTFELITSILNTGQINPSNAYIDPHNQYLLVNGGATQITYPWECFKISTKSCLWYKLGVWTVSLPIWYSNSPNNPTSSMCLQNRDFYGFDLSSGIDLETGNVGTLLHKVANTNCTNCSNCSGGKTIQIRNIVEKSVYINGKYSKIIGTYNKETKEIDFECAQLGKGTIPLVDTGLVRDFLPIKFIQRVGQSSIIIVVQKNNVLHCLTLQ